MMMSLRIPKLSLHPLLWFQCPPKSLKDLQVVIQVQKETDFTEESREHFPSFDSGPEGDWFYRRKQRALFEIWFRLRRRLILPRKAESNFRDLKRALLQEKSSQVVRLWDVGICLHCWFSDSIIEVLWYYIIYCMTHVSFQEKGCPYRALATQWLSVGWRRDVPEPFAARPEDRNPASLARERIEEEEYNKDGYEVRMFWFVCWSSWRFVHKYNRCICEEDTSSLGRICDEEGGWQVVFGWSKSICGEPTEATAENLCLDIHNNLKFSPRLCLWAIERKLKETDEKPPPGSFAEFVLNQLRKYIEGRSAIDDDYYKHLVINTQSRTFEDANYVNSIGSKVVIRPLSETLEFSAKKDLQLQRTVMWKDLPPSSQDAMDTGDLPSGEIPESTEEAEAVDLPSGEMAVEATADVPEDLPTGKRSRTEAKEEDVEMEEVKEEEPPQVDPDASLAPEEEAPDFERRWNWWWCFWDILPKATACKPSFELRNSR